IYRCTSNVYASLAHNHKAIHDTRAQLRIGPNPELARARVRVLLLSRPLPHPVTHASAPRPRRHHATPPPPRRTDGRRAGRDGRVHLRRVLAVQVRARHRLPEQPRLPPRLHRLHRVLRRHL
uniref:Uncharacterized protein n=1 Tax=Aegilops tauschii subsp. strangulata TaxID=200361 RepID=A0A453P697_AEGTS